MAEITPPEPGKSSGTIRIFAKLDEDSALKVAKDLKKILNEAARAFESPATKTVFSGLKKSLTDAISAADVGEELLGTLRKLGTEAGDILAEALNDAMRRASEGAAEIAHETSKTPANLAAAKGEARELAGALKDVRIVMLSIAAATGLVIKDTIHMEVQFRRFSAFFNSYAKSMQLSSEVMDALIMKANQFGVEFEDVLQLGVQFMVVTGTNIRELDKWVERAARLAVRNPLKTMGDAARALTEYLAGQRQSIERQFNVPMTLIAEAVGLYSDLGDQIDYILNKLGLTSEAAIKGRNSFMILRNEIKLTLIEALRPVIDLMRQLAEAFAGILYHLRTVNPELLKFVGTFMLFTAVTKSVQGLIQQIIMLRAAMATLAGAQIGVSVVGSTAVGSALGQGVGAFLGSLGAAGFAAKLGEGLKAALAAVGARLIPMLPGIVQAGLSGITVALAGVIGVIIGQLIVQAIGHLAPEQIVGSEFKQFLQGWNFLDEGIKTIKQLLVVAYYNLRSIPETVKPPSDQLAELGEISSTAFMDSAQIAALEDNAARAGSAQARIVDDVRSFASSLGLIRIPTAYPEEYRFRPIPRPTFEPDQIRFMMEFRQRALDIEQQYNRAMLEENNQYYLQLYNLNYQYNLSTLRESQDFARRRKRAWEDFSRSIAEVEAEQKERVARAVQDLNLRIADLYAEYNKRVEDINREFQKRRERLEREHKLSLMEAAANLDARAVAMEQRRFAERMRELDEEHREQLAEAARWLAESVQKAQESHARQLEEQAKADEKRIKQMRDNFLRQLAREDEDRGVSASRREQDHQNQLRQLNNAHEARKRAIDNAHDEELRKLKDFFMMQISAWDNFGKTIALILRGRQEEAIKFFQDFWRQLIREWQQSGGNRPHGLQEYQHGGPVKKTGLALLHAGEFVLSPEMVRMSLLPATALTSMISVGGVQIGPIVQQPGQSPIDVAYHVERAIMNVFRRLA